MVEIRPEVPHFQENKILFLTKDQEILQNQLAGFAIDSIDYTYLANNVPTEDIFQTKDVFDITKDTIGQRALTGFEGIKEGDIQNNGINILVAGENFGCESGREHAVVVLKQSGIKYIFAKSFAPLFRQNCINNGIFPLTNFELLQQYQQGKEVALEELLNEFDEVEQQILKQGGLLPFSAACQEGRTTPPTIETQPRPMTMAEKIIAAHTPNVEFVKPGDYALTALSPYDTCFTYEFHTGLIQQILNEAERMGIQIPTSPTILPILFEDHGIWWGHPKIVDLLETHADFAGQHHLPYYPRSSCFEDNLAAQGICHTLVLENHALPGSFVIGTDSHTCTAGALGSLGICLQPSAIANAFLTNKALLPTPESFKVVFNGQLDNGSAKDAMLHLLAKLKELNHPALGKIIEFSGKGLEAMPVDQLSVLTNMATEAGALSGIIQPTDAVIKWLMEKRNLSRQEVVQMIVTSDPEAQYSQVIEVNLSKIPSMVALPGHAENSIPLAALGKVPVHKAFVGSCTGGNFHDLEQAALILKGQTVNPDVQLVIQAASMAIYNQAVQQGLARIFQDAGAWFLQPACGACIGLGPGKIKQGETIISASNRNSPNRMGKGGKDIYLASPAVVAASAIAGKICHPDEL